MGIMLNLVERRGLLAGYLTLVGLFLIIDPILDLRHGEGLTHVLTEAALALITFTGVVVILWDIRQQRSRRRLLEERLQDARGDIAHWRSEAQGLLAGLGVAIDRQFQRWGLTPAERDVGILLLKGLSHKQAADVRATSERTVRQQARELYRKAEVGGRAELSAWFLEDLLLPDSAQIHREPSGADAAPVQDED